jgi:hypothetical protein
LEPEPVGLSVCFDEDDVCTGMVVVVVVVVVVSVDDDDDDDDDDDNDNRLFDVDVVKKRVNIFPEVSM